MWNTRSAIIMLAVGIVTAAAAFTTAAVHAQDGSPARVRVVHMSPDAPPLDVAVDGQRTITNLAFRAASEYAALPAGSRSVRVTPTGQDQNAVIAADLPLQAGQALTVVALGRLADVTALPLQDDNAPPPAGKAKVRFVHTSPDAPPVDVSVRGGPLLFPNVGFKSVAGYVPVEPGTYALEVRPAGTSTIALNVPNVTLQPGQVVTIFATGLLGNNTLAAVPVVYAGGAQAPAVLSRSGRGGALQADAAPSPVMLAALLLAATLVLGGVAARIRGR